LGFDNQKNRARVGLQVVGFILLEHCAHGCVDIDSRACCVEFDCDFAVCDQKCCSVGDGGCWDLAVIFDMNSADMGVAVAVREW
jgi:hypothetical protein